MGWWEIEVSYCRRLILASGLAQAAGWACLWVSNFGFKMPGIPEPGFSLQVGNRTTLYERGSCFAGFLGTLQLSLRSVRSRDVVGARRCVETTPSGWLARHHVVSG